MESIKHKMDSMKKEEIAAIEKAAVFVKVFNEKRIFVDIFDKRFCEKKRLKTRFSEKETVEYEAAGAKYVKEIGEIQRKIARLEDDLDITITKTKETGEKFEGVEKIAVDAELQAGALKVCK